MRPFAFKFGAKSQERSFIGLHRFNLFSVMSRIDDSLVVLGCLLLVTGRSEESLAGLHAVVAPLFFCGGVLLGEQ